MPDIRKLLDDPRIRSLCCITASVALTAAAFWLAACNVAATPRRAAVAAESTGTPVFRMRTDLKVTPVPIPTPVFACYGDLDLHLPVKPRSVTVIAFHQAGSRPVALHMRSLIPVVKSSQLSTAPGSVPTTGPAEAAEIASAEDGHEASEVYDGEALRLWRSGRAGTPDTAADVGAKPGTPILAPVSGTITAVHRYKLYGQYDDYEIHIRPDDADVDVCILHTDDPKVRVGDAVQAGVTQLASVRWLSRWFDSQLDYFTHDGGNHVHIQIDQLTRDHKVQLMGGLETEFGTPKATPAATPPAD